MFLKAGGGVEVREVDKPRAGRGELVVKLGVCGVCGTDLEKARGHGVTTAILGHEVAGVVEEVGEGVEDLEEWEHVFVHHHVSCGRCHYCLNGNPTMCSLFLRTNIEPCGFAEYFRVPSVNVERGAVIKLPKAMSLETASFIEPLACCVKALNRIHPSAGFSSAVIGFGPMGALFTMLLRLSGASYICVGDVSEFRLGFAGEAGADDSVNLAEGSMREACLAATGGRGVDLAVVSTGNLKAYEEALRVVRRGGAVCVFGAPGRGARLELDFSKLFIDELSLIPSYSTSERETRQAFELLRTGRVNPLPLITHVYRLEDAVEAFATAADPSRSMKVLVRA